MMGGRSPPDPLRFGNAVSVGSSAGWTDEKHMHYITSLEESFVNQLHNREFDSKGLFCQSPEGYWGKVVTNGAEFRSSQIEYAGSPCSGFQENNMAYYMDNDTSTNFPQHERTSNASRSQNSGRFVASYSQWDQNSLPRTTGLLHLFLQPQQYYTKGKTAIVLQQNHRVRTLLMGRLKVPMNTAEGVEKCDRNRKQGLHRTLEKLRDQSDGPCRGPEWHGWLLHVCKN